MPACSGDFICCCFASFVIIVSPGFLLQSVLFVHLFGYLPVEAAVSSAIVINGNTAGNMAGCLRRVIIVSTDELQPRGPSP